MRETRIMLHLPGVRVKTITRGLARFPFGILAFTMLLFTSDAASQTPANTQQPNPVSGGQAEISYVDDAENNAYNAAKRELDPKKRVAMLFEFHQKYPKSELMQQTDYEDIKVIEGEYNVYYAAKLESGFEKRAAMLIEFAKKYPESPFMGNVNNEYMSMLRESSQGKKYELLESFAEKWREIHPNDKETYAFIAEAAMNLQEYEKCGKSLEAIYVMQPSSSLAREIQVCYQNADNMAKQTEWAEKLFKMPEFDDDYMLRYNFAKRFYNGNNLPTAAEFARLTLKSAELVKQPDANTQEQLRQVRQVCHHIIARNLVVKGSFTEAIAEFEKAIEAEKYWQGYYGIGLCLDSKKALEEAISYYAAAELMGGADALNAKDRLDILYKALHNDTLIGIDKVYNKAIKLLAEAKG